MAKSNGNNKKTGLIILAIVALAAGIFVYKNRGDKKNPRNSGSGGGFFDTAKPPAGAAGVYPEQASNMMTGADQAQASRSATSGCGCGAKRSII